MKFFKRAISILLVVVLVAGGICLADKVTERTVSRQKYIKYFSEQKEYDVLFYGSSHVLSGLQPMEIWDNYGITSYNLAGHAASLGMSYWVLRESLRYHKPKLAVLDIYDMYAFDQPYMDVSFMHYSLDAYPPDRMKFEAVRDLLKGRSTGEKTELLFPFSVYHSRWNEVTEQSLKESFSDDYFNPYYGSEARYGVAVPMDIDRVPAQDVTEGSDGADDYIRGFVKICEDAGVQVCFMRVPYPASVENQRAENRAMKLAEELGIEVIDMMDDVEGAPELLGENVITSGELSSPVVDWDTDLVDPNAHLNAYGAYKVSLFLGEWLKRVYGFTDKREDPDYANWNEDFEKVYIPALNTDLKLQSDFKTCLMLSAYPEYETELQVTEHYQPDEVCEKLIKEHGGLIKISSFGETIENSILEKSETEFSIADSGGTETDLSGAGENSGKTETGLSETGADSGGRNEASESFILEPGQTAYYYDLDGQTLGTEPDASTLTTPVARMIVRLRGTGEVVADKVFLQ